MDKNKSIQSAPRISRQERQAQTREELIAAAMQLFVARGYGGTSIRDIADVAGYSQGAFYSNFESKEALLLEMLRAHMQNEAAQLMQLIEQPARSASAILQTLEQWAEAIDGDVNWSMLSIELQLHAQRSSPFAVQYRAIWLQHQADLAQLIGQVFTKSRCTLPLGSQEIASVLMALAHGLSLQRAVVGEGVATGRALIVVLRGLLALGSSPRKRLQPANAN
ncbi:TetR/AcrR family transcriptional regulator [Lampropedia puyangensis]|uniref:TetR/AcrR family transcriptional regulator n=1 Tax=Lampropedia puyangensis TaxID=1330072 RepID=A0A4S8FC41_9BURK|nr:TetR/AcrR family transcriptional regulator [Lampropedia puyangensis]THU05130.1 TetR/AcrR family transcriptional regulator [Lampropedia puyangensis]